MMKDKCQENLTQIRESTLHYVPVTTKREPALRPSESQNGLIYSYYDLKFTQTSAISSQSGPASTNGSGRSALQLIERGPRLKACLVNPEQVFPLDVVGQINTREFAYENQ